MCNIILYYTNTIQLKKKTILLIMTFFWVVLKFFYTIKMLSCNTNSLVDNVKSTHKFVQCNTLLVKILPISTFCIKIAFCKMKFYACIWKKIKNLHFIRKQFKMEEKNHLHVFYEIKF